MCGGQVFGEKPYCQGDETNKGLQRDLASPRSSEDLLVSGCCPAMKINQQGNAQIPILGTVWKDQVTCRGRNPKSSTGREESRDEPSVPGGSVSVGQLKATALNRSGLNELWVQSLAGQLEDPITPNPHGLSENEPKAKQIEEVTALSCKPQHRQALNAFPFLKIDFLFSKLKYKMNM